MKVTLIGGGGARTPLLVHGLARAHDDLRITELALYDADRPRAELMAALAGEITREHCSIRITTPQSVETAVEGAAFVLSSIRVGGINARARDEELVVKHGLTGQETTGPGGLAMALRTIPVALMHARAIERHAPGAYLINFTNPAGLITQALHDHSGVRTIGICDTPSELFHRIAAALGEPLDDVDCRYAGLNHLGWVNRVIVRGQDAMSRLLHSDDTLLRLHPARLFDPGMIRVMGLIPSEYLFFVYARTLAYRNQLAAGATRGGELLRMNQGLFEGLGSDVRSGKPAAALNRYKAYLNERNASYLRLESHAQSAPARESQSVDPFEAATGYHRIAIDVMTALCSHSARQVVVNVRNGSAIPDLAPADIVEVPCSIDRNGARPLATGPLPGSVRGLVQSVKEYEKLAIRAAVKGSLALAKLSLLIYPVVAEWEPAERILKALIANDPEHLGYLG